MTEIRMELMLPPPPVVRAVPPRRPTFVSPLEMMLQIQMDAKKTHNARRDMRVSYPVIEIWEVLTNNGDNTFDLKSGVAGMERVPAIHRTAKKSLQDGCFVAVRYYDSNRQDPYIKTSFPRVRARRIAAAPGWGYFGHNVGQLRRSGEGPWALAGAEPVWIGWGYMGASYGGELFQDGSQIPLVRTTSTDVYFMAVDPTTSGGVGDWALMKVAETSSTWGAVTDGTFPGWNTKLESVFEPANPDRWMTPIHLSLEEDAAITYWTEFTL